MKKKANIMMKLAAISAVLLLGACAATCEPPALYEPIEHCGPECTWERD